MRYSHDMKRSRVITKLMPRTSKRTKKKWMISCNRWKCRHLSGLLYYALCLYFATFAKSVFCVRFLTTICNLRTIKNCILRKNFLNFLYFASNGVFAKYNFSSKTQRKIQFLDFCKWRKIQIVPEIITQNTVLYCSQTTK